MSSTKSKNVVVCLQEVSYDWAGQFHTFFANKGYQLVTGLYGRKFNGYMGVAMAYPMEAFETVDVDISRLADKRVGGWPKKPEETMSTKVWNTMRYPFKQVGLVSDPPEDHWSMSQRRFNVLLTLTLKEKATDHTFCISTYHMPCAFYAPMAMTLHAEMAAKHIQDIASKKQEEGVDEGSSSYPYVLTGDFNIVPREDMDTGPVYDMLVSGKLDESSPCFPAPKNGMNWSCTIDPMRSAYAVKNGKEPEFTNYARVKEKDPFVDTLDYIFLSPEWTVKDVKDLVGKDDAGGPFPNANEPSDHILIRADLEL
uniref:Endonuclease/exonuclease/phosphatase domain-containing protein n=1 Tax=Grammatophora oceanica TaxID=210454 RepID=A0A7S1V4M6_9STRA|mmetsp:Transcript_35033/g.52089  ORF Transcript_35033/g.52089 Transcript_35033/m.52089 type:complete len:311 (+) Transcript_35033:102-1034(+)|eukprot:CAMPEP_0194030308 /NCGR_PEP_ID=MMETSP0009_2-20130614/3853_1 /TAXON_ID=210454 /ORGANISM="Grammatophora oceanica, Strain CCMP 410" /LENGTH=310 /DNA_ID=CAMNT_0038670243 /DNA_START=710 /DNA_END=1642 /DNA_ORIENTATION=-